MTEDNIDLSRKKLVEICYASGTYYRMSLFYCESDKSFYVDDEYEVHDTYTHDRHHTYMVDECWALNFCLSKRLVALRKLKDIMGIDLFNELFEKEYLKKWTRDMQCNQHVDMSHNATAFFAKDGSAIYLRDASGTVYKKTDEKWLIAEYDALRLLLDNEERFDVKNVDTLFI